MTNLMGALTTHSTNLAMVCDTVNSNRKLGKAAATYVTQESCPASCPLLGNGCYAETGMVRYTTDRYYLASNTNKVDWYEQLEIACAEADLIDNLQKPLPLRLHVVGDSPTVETTAILAEAARWYIERHKQPVWTYTHAWRTVPRSEWQPISVLASAHSFADAAVAHKEGYAPAVVVPSHVSPLATMQNGFRAIPCPAQTGRAANCTSCRLCFNADKLWKYKSAITFAAHGARKKKAAQTCQG